MAWLGGSEEFPRIEANEGGDDTAIANPVPSVPPYPDSGQKG